MSIATTTTFSQSFESVLQDRLDQPLTWKEACDVTISDQRTINSSYESTAPSAQAVTRYTGFDITTTAYVETNDTLTISTGRDVGYTVDWGDLSQSPWTKPAELFDRIGSILNEYVESFFLADHASWTDFTNASIGGSAGNITVSASNIDDIIRGIKREIRENNAWNLATRNGICFVWRPADFEYLEAFVQANGFSSADSALKNGTNAGLMYMGCDHYFSNGHTSGHVFAGVKKIQRLGILRGTYGRAFTIDFPAADTNAFISGRTFYSRVDVGRLVPRGHSTAIFDVTVA